ncbi:alpha-1-inhibitor 3-like [Palaemon carinicauda]|uniref:alpha-1-inhibitor 3-like n=1 Tax=Palaemon carinicauda TaxID=392227 RepID=UPI0035B659F5
MTVLGTTSRLSLCSLVSVAMAWQHSAFLLSIICCLCLQATYGGYLITTPREVTVGSKTQFCIFVTDPDAPEGSVDVSFGEDYSRISTTAINPPIIKDNIKVPAGKAEFCHDLDVSNSDFYQGSFNVTGTLSGKDLNHTGRIRIRSSSTKRVFIQTDKHQYQPGDKVQFRLLTVTGPILNVSTNNYPEVWIETPSKTRIAQWLDVDNSQGIVHLSMDLVDEPEEGFYHIRLKTSEGNSKTQNFKVGEYVLPRFEVTIKTPSYVLSTDASFNFSVCATYTFGQPVKGNLTVEFNNGQSQLCRTEFTRIQIITGCHDFEFTTEEMKVIDCSVHYMPLVVTFEEEGTGIRMSEFSSVSITREPITLNPVYIDKYMKPNLPFTAKVRAEYPDGAPASGLQLEVCAAGKCNNMTTAADGIVTAVLPNYKSNRIFMKTINYRADLHSASFSRNPDHYYSPSNSSILIYTPEEKLKCSSNESLEHSLTLLFAASQPSAKISVQVISRGQIQHTITREYQLTPSELPFRSEHLVEPLQDPHEGIFRGVLNISLTLPNSVSPKAMVLAWYTREDGEVVSDAREIEIEKCLRNSADINWEVKRAQPGEDTSVSLSSKPNSVCGIGVVDRSTMLLSQASDRISLESLFNFIDDFSINTYSNRQTDDYTYCQRKHEEELPGSVQDEIWPMYYHYYTLYVDALQMFDESGVYVFTDQTVETRPCERAEGYDSLGGGGGYAPVANYDHYGAPVANYGHYGAPVANYGHYGAPVANYDHYGAPVANYGHYGAPVANYDHYGAPVANYDHYGAPVAENDIFEKESAFISGEDESIRTDFPETWLWDVVVVPSTGVYNRTVTVPDTITEWVGSAVCVLPNEGIVVSQESSITSFLPFFVDLTLPPSVKRGEILPIKISVFNYLKQTLPITIRLEESSEYLIVDEPTEEVKGQRTTCLAAQDKDVVTVKIDLLSLGDVNLTVTAFIDYDNSDGCNTDDKSVSKRDTIIRPIKVEAEGYPREKSWTKYICSEDFEAGDDGFEVWEVSAPPVIVEGSDRGWVTAVGDLLALSLENLGSLIRMPYGCGEQNMVNFVPNIFIMKYLDVTQQNTPEASEKLRKFMRTGYRRELLYRHPNGAFSAFGSADDSGSTWLTAFVLKSFAQAQPYILVDKADLNETRRWLQNQQDEDGCFLSVGKVFQKGMQGGIDSGNNSIPLTTYVMISLLEAAEDPSSPTIELAQKCIISNVSSDPYTLALKAYALTLAKHSRAQETIDELLKLAVVTKNATYWELPKSPSKSKAVELETAAYAILAFVEHDFETYEPQVRKIVKWIMTQRNGYGGFYSTQDTVMALQAMAKYESFLHQGPLDVTITMEAKNVSHSFSVNDSNNLLQQMVGLVTFPTNITFGMEGQGCAVVQAVYRYNIPEPEASDAFDLTVNSRTALDNNCKTKLITACASYQLPDGKSNMAVIEVNLVSGYIPEKEDLKLIVSKNPSVIKRYEVDGSKVSFYIEELTAEATCINFKIIREVDVENVKPGTVLVYDYYQPEFFISENYILPAPEDCRRI